MSLIYHPEYAHPIAVRLTRPMWVKPLILDFEGLTDRLGSQQAEEIWAALYVRGEHTDKAGTRYVRMVPIVEDDQ